MHSDMHVSMKKYGLESGMVGRTRRKSRRNYGVAWTIQALARNKINLEATRSMLLPKCGVIDEKEELIG